MPTPIFIRPIPPRIPTAPKTPPTREPIPFPTGTPPGNKRPTDLDNCPQICAWVKVPTKIPKKIVYQYPSELPVVIEGETWTTEVTSGNYNLIENAYYTVTFTAINRYGWVIYHFFGVYGNFTITRPPGGYPGGNHIKSRFMFSGIVYETVIDWGSYGSLYEIDFDHFNMGANALRRGTFQITGVYRDGVTPVYPQSTCRFRVFNSLGITILDITRDVCPTVTEIPEQCIYPDGYELAYKVTKAASSLTGNTLSVETRGNCIDIKHQILPFPPIKITVKTFCSPAGCPPPRYKIDCCEELDCRDKKCPSGTKTRVLIGGRLLQCVDANGCVIKEIPYDPKCEKVDCRC